MSSDEKIWDIAKWRFLQSDARLWIIGNKGFEIAFLVGTAMWVYFEFFSSGNFQLIKYLGLALSFGVFAAIRGRYSCYVSYLDGYEQGFKDASARNLDYWGSTHSETSDEVAISSVLNDIEKNEEQISHENRESRDEEVKQGFSKLIGYFLTWRRLR